MPVEWHTRIQEVLKRPDAPATEAHFIRLAIRNELDRAEMADRIRELEERQAATLTEMHGTLNLLSRSIQALGAFLTSYAKASLARMPEVEEGRRKRAIESAERSFGLITEDAARELAKGAGNGTAAA